MTHGATPTTYTPRQRVFPRDGGYEMACYRDEFNEQKDLRAAAKEVATVLTLIAGIFAVAYLMARVLAS